VRMRRNGGHRRVQRPRYPIRGGGQHFGDMVSD